ncbi:TetR family transcriptional regulator [Nonomuraea phyllanthi]|uniref:TetR family transcriptional regulator n=1 Tax=Nonomuraea phyllanthi TaxID=2219224 RepID=A0A5C4WMP5_9ACTN|nr:TetR/AcrR family transcriptional regulator [Nonomuraea phyllanthi]KAB8194889.1 TetR family transcriptional regulator [Nonomuraea phyllanthi]
MQRTRSAILDAAARVLGRRPDAALAEIADEAGVGRATLYRHFPTRESLLSGVAGIAELADGFAAANLGELPADRAIARIVAVFLRNGGKYAAVIRNAGQYCDPADLERTAKPVREVLARGVRDQILRADLHEDMQFALFSAIVERALRLTLDEATTPEEATEAAVAIFLDGARKPD